MILSPHTMMMIIIYLLFNCNPKYPEAKPPWSSQSFIGDDEKSKPIQVFIHVMSLDEKSSEKKTMFPSSPAKMFHPKLTYGGAFDLDLKTFGQAEMWFICLIHVFFCHIIFQNQSTAS